MLCSQFNVLWSTVTHILMYIQVHMTILQKPNTIAVMLQVKKYNLNIMYKEKYHLLKLTNVC